MAVCGLDCSLPAFLALDFLPFFLESVQEDLAEQQLLPASALPQELLDLVHSVLALSPPVQLCADAVAPKRKRAPRRRMCFMIYRFCIKDRNSCVQRAMPRVILSFER